MTSNPLKYSVVLPAYFEHENLSVLLPQLKLVLNKVQDSYEIIVIDACDRQETTAQLCENLDVRYSNRQPSNKYGDAVRTGIAQAVGKYIIFMDADGSHPPEFLTKLIANCHLYDLIIASRYVSGGNTENSKLLVAMSKLLNLVYSVFLKCKVSDVSNSFRLYKADQLKQLKLRCENFDIIQEILVYLIKKNPDIKIKELAFSFKKRLTGESKRNLFVFIMSYLKTLIRLILCYHIQK
jgi:dolichol-phosphate mannosyltransferase